MPAKDVVAVIDGRSVVVADIVARDRVHQGCERAADEVAFPTPRPVFGHVGDNEIACAKVFEDTVKSINWLWIVAAGHAVVGAFADECAFDEVVGQTTIAVVGFQGDRPFRALGDQLINQFYGVVLRAIIDHDNLEGVPGAGDGFDVVSNRIHNALPLIVAGDTDGDQRRHGGNG